MASLTPNLFVQELDILKVNLTSQISFLQNLALHVNIMLNYPGGEFRPYRDEIRVRTRFHLG